MIKKTANGGVEPQRAFLFAPAAVAREGRVARRTFTETGDAPAAVARPPAPRRTFTETGDDDAFFLEAGLSRRGQRARSRSFVRVCTSCFNGIYYQRQRFAPFVTLGGVRSLVPWFLGSLGSSARLQKPARALDPGVRAEDHFPVKSQIRTRSSGRVGPRGRLRQSAEDVNAYKKMQVPLPESNQRPARRPSATLNDINRTSSSIALDGVPGVNSPSSKNYARKARAKPIELARPTDADPAAAPPKP